MLRNAGPPHFCGSRDDPRTPGSVGHGHEERTHRGIVTWVYAAAFGLPAAPVSIHLMENGRLPNLWGMFDMYAGPWSASSSDDRFVRLLLGFLAVTLIVAWSGWLLWRGQRLGALLNLAVLPVEVVFWYGFALPIPWILALVRVVAVAGAWRSLSWRRPHAGPVG